jgi:hypothetical protein
MWLLLMPFIAWRWTVHCLSSRRGSFSRSNPARPLITGRGADECGQHGPTFMLWSIRYIRRKQKGRSVDVFRLRRNLIGQDAHAINGLRVR